MNILDENILVDQHQALRNWRIPIRHFGHNVGRSGMQDDEIISFLHQLRHPTFFTRDWDFYNRGLCHSRYCLVYLVVEKSEVATFVRKLLRHPDFDAEAKRMGTVIRAMHSGIVYWRLHVEFELHTKWNK